MTNSMEERFNEKFPKALTASNQKVRLVKDEDIFSFIYYEISLAVQDREDVWKTAVAYNCEPEEIERIHRVVVALLTPTK